jgi:hypothetical protein
VAAALAIGVTLVAAIEGKRHMVSYLNEPGRRFQQVMLGQGPAANFTSAFAVSKGGIFCQVIADGRYVLVWLHGEQSEKLRFDGEAFGPVATTKEGPIYFELVTRGTTTWWAFDAETRRASLATAPQLVEGANSGLSPDGKWLAFERKVDGGQQVWLRKAGSDRAELLAGGRCVNASPTWELDSKAILFSSDCQRGIGLTALYRAPISSK